MGWLQEGEYYVRGRQGAIKRSQDAAKLQYRSLAYVTICFLRLSQGCVFLNLATNAARCDRGRNEIQDQTR